MFCFPPADSLLESIHPLWAGIAAECLCSYHLARNAVEVPALFFRQSYVHWLSGKQHWL